MHLKAPLDCWSALEVDLLIPKLDKLVAQYFFELMPLKTDTFIIEINI